nr:MAG TPA: hypothetical protein [Caudoviricetes sp.]
MVVFLSDPASFIFPRFRVRVKEVVYCRRK